MKKKTFNINKLNISKAEEIIRLTYNDLIAFGKFFLPGDFMKTSTPAFHYKIGDELIAPTTKPCAIIVPRDHAKMGRLDQLILTERGWVTFGDIGMEDRVYGSDGKLHNIIDISMIQEKEFFEIKTRDGRTFIASGDHVWTVRLLNGLSKRKKGIYEDYTTKQLIGKRYNRPRIDKRNGRLYDCFMFAIDCPAPIDFKEKSLPLDPYTLGVLIGDGSLMGTPIVSCHGDDIEEMMSNIPYKLSLRNHKNGCPSFSVLGVVDIIRKLGLNVTSHYKFIPQDYLYSSVQQRLNLLRGLMDTDGTIHISGDSLCVSYSTVSEELANNVVSLVRSLGGKAYKSFHQNDYDGYYYVGVKIRLNPFRLSRKASKFVPASNLWNAIVSIKSVGVSKGKCIAIDSEDKLYVVNDYLLTHNSTLVKAKIIRDFCFSQKAYEWGLADESRYLFYGWVSDTQKKSIKNVKYIKQHLSYNEKLKRYFGDISGEFVRNKTWTQEDIETANGNRLISRSNLSSLRGETEASIYAGILRYGAVFIDDAENEENMKTINSRDNIRNIIMNAIFPAIDKSYGRMFVVGTPVHYDSFIQRILDEWLKVAGTKREHSYGWKVLYWGGATQPNMPGGSLWPSRLSPKVLEEIKRVYIDTPGKGVSGYYQEYELQVQSAEDAIWTRKHIKEWHGYYEWDEEAEQGFLVINKQRIPVLCFIGCDPATDIDTRQSDFSVIMVVAVDPDNNVYVLEYERHRAIPVLGIRGKEGNLIGKAGVVDHILRLYDKYHCRSATVEDVAMNRSVFQSVNAEKRRLNRFDFAIIPEKPGGTQKRNRIYTGLGSRFSMGTIHLRENHFDLSHEILTFGPRMSYDDTIESLYYALVYAYPPGMLKVQKENKKGIVLEEWEKPPKKKPRSWITL